MKLDTKALKQLKEACDVVPGNIYPAMGGRRPGTDYWVVLAVTGSSAHLVGFNMDGDVVSTASYLKSAMRARPIIGFCEVSMFKLNVESK